MSNYSDKERDSILPLYYEQIHQMNQTTPEDLDKLLEYFKQYPEDADEIYKEVFDRVAEAEGET